MAIASERTTIERHLDELYVLKDYTFGIEQKQKEQAIAKAVAAVMLLIESGTFHIQIQTHNPMNSDTGRY